MPLPMPAIQPKNCGLTCSLCPRPCESSPPLSGPSHDIRPEAVDDDTRQVLVRLQGQLPVLSAVHAEGLAGIGREVEIFEVVTPQTEPPP